MLWESLKLFTLKIMVLNTITIVVASLILWSDRRIAKDALTVETDTDSVSTQIVAE
jgi:hypothetical protein